MSIKNIDFVYLGIITTPIIILGFLGMPLVYCVIAIAVLFCATPRQS